MTDTLAIVRNARDALAKGLEALQSDPKLPVPLREAANPMAQAIGALHQMEQTGGPPAANLVDGALSSLRDAHQRLQSEAQQNATAAKAAATVATSAGLLQQIKSSASAVATQVAAPRPVASGADGLVIEAPLGAQSPTNFYKGLSGNDIVDHGGLFVATYKIPKIGTNVRLKVSLPGGYEFEAGAVVRWRRDPNEAGDAPPGFGAQFTQISQEDRQLVYRYVRNREPLFHDDL